MTGTAAHRGDRRPLPRAAVDEVDGSGPRVEELAACRERSESRYARP
jgi:hypothetical protein